MLKIKFLILVLFVGVAALFVHQHQKDVNKVASTAKDAAVTAQQTATDAQAISTAAEAAKICAGNKLEQNIIISIKKQHLWACEGPVSKYDSAVVTGMELYPADLTPIGAYKIYGKQTNQTLTGSDATGSWSDPVSYWEPFLNNKYGQYGFHDATWRPSSEFGNVNINAPYTTDPHGSHGCVELPLSAAKWIYNWSSVGTTVTIES